MGSGYLAWDQGLKEVELEMDSKVAIQLLSNEVLKVNSQTTLVNKLKELLNRDWEGIKWRIS